MGRTDEQAENIIEKARLIFWRWFHFQQAIRFGFLGELGFDLTHFSETNRFANAGRVDPVFGGQRDISSGRAGHDCSRRG